MKKWLVFDEEGGSRRLTELPNGKFRFPEPFTIEADELRFEGGVAVFYRDGDFYRALSPAGFVEIKPG